MQRWRRIAAGGALGLALAAGGLGLAWAGERTELGGLGARMDQALERFGVTTSQVRELRAAGDRMLAEQQAVAAKPLPPGERRRRLLTVRQEFFQKADQTLTGEQKTKLKLQAAAIREAQAPVLRKRLAQAATELKLTSKQRRRVETELAEAQQAIHRLQMDPALDDPARLAGGIGVLEGARSDVYRVLSPVQKRKAGRLLEAALQSGLTEALGL